MSAAPIAITPELRLVMSVYFVQAALAADADAVLAESGLGRPHHRVIVFVGLNPGITVGELLKLLRIRGQSLNPVLGQLIKAGLITQTTGDLDRRQRHLHLTEKGASLHRRASAPQTARIERALATAQPATKRAVFEILESLMDPSDREYMSGVNAPARDVR